MAGIKINQNKCKGCMLCVSTCPKGLIKAAKKLNKRGVYYVEFKAEEKQRCTGCSMCAIICPDMCIEVYK